MQGPRSRYTPAAFLLASGTVLAQDIGPSPPTITGTVNVSTPRTVVGSTVFSITTPTPALNVTGGTLTLDAAAGPVPGPISLTTTTGTALRADGGAIVVPGGVGIQTGGGLGALANGAASSVNFSNGGTIATTGVGAALAAIGGSIDATGVAMTSGAASSGHGAIAEGGGTVRLHAGTNISRGGASGFFGNAVGLGASGAGSRVIADALIPVTMSGRGAMGIYLHDGGQVSLVPGSTLQINGSSSVGIAVDNTAVPLGTLGRGLAVNLAAAPDGFAASSGLVALNGGSIALEDLTVQGANAAAGAWARPGSRIALSGRSLLRIDATTNPTYYTLNTAYLVTVDGPVRSIFGVTSGLPIGGLLANAGAITSTGTTVEVSPARGVGAFAGSASATPSTIDLIDNTISTTGSISIGLQADSNGAITARDSRVTTTGGGAALLAAAFNGPSSIALTNTAVLAQGAGTVGLYSDNDTPALVNNVSLSGGSLVSAAATAIEVEGPLNLKLSNGAVASGGSGLLLDAFANSFGTQATFLRLDASGASVLTGDARADAQSRVDIGLATGSRWSGAALGITNVAVDAASSWNVTGNSVLTQTLSNAGLVAFTPPSAGAFKTLSVANYVGQGGTLGLNTVLGGDGSPSDRLVINGGTATGLTGLRITNAGGVGAVTLSNGIQVVDAINGGSTAAGAFVLGSRVVAGPYEYQLFRSSLDASNPQAWYLRSQREIVPPVPPPVPPPNPDIVPPIVVPLYRPEIGAYLGNQRQAGGLFLHSLHDRLGEPQWIETQRFDEPDDKRRSAWLRVVGRKVDSTSRDGTFDVDTDSSLVQGGGDIARWSVGGDTGRLHLGGMLGYGEARSDATAAGNPAQARGKTDGWNLGAYGTWYQNDDNKLGWYADAWASYGWFKNTVQGDTLPEVRYDSRVLTLSGETGYAMRIRENSDWVVEPQAQLIYIRYSEDGFAEVNGTRIDGSDGSGWISRLGMRTQRTWVNDAGRRTQPYLTLNWWHDSVDNALAFNSVALKDMYPKDRYEAKVGVNADLGRGWTGWGNLGYQWGSQGYSATTLRLGGKYTW
ncbi:autotransporter outer membrane beta-barrel domain-containing protein [Variovorax sp. J22P271]|uniref:autotransporter family protein n=1 Tax=Variovorax davisae TaxID=3053515 RepID=UPI0025758E84|nr:autotransporter outer membrane beta-barrel domain-containing protein [Variovorax sp. J22P271]MDM0031767.1 autotransporter outer membrane beta-barrel domain-containing protein [Variovorax sp. J22P271]